MYETEDAYKQTKLSFYHNVSSAELMTIFFPEWKHPNF